jgi:pSer/pThr/pTyr-binding forkhead associated (FHA) protein
MPIELHIVSGSRAGHREVFDRPVVAVGRHPRSDLRFDPTQDLDVSTRHAEILSRDGRFRVRDTNSTNGTFVNGQRIEGEHDLSDGDVISFGGEGPRVEVRIPSSAAGQPGSMPGTVQRTSQKRPTTGERVRVAVLRETATMRRLLAAGVVLLALGIAAAYWAGHRDSDDRVNQMRALLAQSESTAMRLQAQLGRFGDTATADALRRQTKDIAARLSSTGSGASQAEIDAIEQELRRNQAMQQGLARMDLSMISERNDAGIAFLVTELDGRPYGASAFGVTPEGLLVTSRHNVRSDRGSAPTRIAVKFANTARYLRAHVVKISADSGIDLALVQVDEAGPFPTVNGIAGSMSDVRPGAPAVTIGFPNALSSPMAGEVVKTSLTAGNVSKLVPSLLQIDAYATHGSSGSPVFDVRGLVIGVVWGGPPDGQGRIVWAVPADAVAAMLPATARPIVR